MSRSTNQERCSWKAVESQARCTVVYYKRHKLTKRDSATYSLAVFAWTLVVFDLLRSPSFDISAAASWMTDVLREDAYDLSCFLKEFTVLLRNYSNSDEESPGRFKHALEAKIGNFDRIVSPIEGVLAEHLADPSATTFKVINQFAAFLTRVTLVDVGHEETALEDYLAVETRLAKTNHDRSLAKELNAIIKPWLSCLSFRDIIPKHGNGAVAERGVTSLEEKYQALVQEDELLRYFLGKCQVALYPYARPEKLDRTCRLQFVPKNALSMRSISMEPATLMFYQQGCWRSIDRWLASHQVLSRHIKLHDQTMNMEYARVGSKVPCKYATIDLSAASDSVSWDLVKDVFRGTEYLAAGWATRSRMVHLPNGKCMPLLKFAPMGSAMCFPTQCLIFAAACEYVVRRYACNTSCSLDYAVYGDDIVILTQVAPVLIDVLTRLGFVVNTTKSFFAVENPFRESCGGEYYDAVDVSPMRIPRRFTGEDINVNSPLLFEQTLEMANAAQRFGFEQLRLWLVHRLLSLPRRLLPLFSEDSSLGLFSETATNYRLEERANERYQIYELRHGTVKTVPAEKEQNEAIRLYEWLRAAASGCYRGYSIYDTPRVAKVAPVRTRLVSGWTRRPNEEAIFPPPWTPGLALDQS